MPTCGASNDNPRRATLPVDTEIKKELPMRLQDWEATIQQIVGECNREQKGADKVLTKWRAKLEQEPTLLQPFQIDEIVRAVRLRLGISS